MLSKLIEHNNWANLRLIEACLELRNEQLDATPLPTSQWSIRRTLIHLASSQQGYLSLLTLPVKKRQDPSLTWEEVQVSVQQSGTGLLALTLDPARIADTKIQTMDGYLVEPWVVIVQVVTHAAEHRQQVSRMLRILDVAAPKLDAWTFGEVTNALVPHALPVNNAETTNDAEPLS